MVGAGDKKMDKSYSEDISSLSAQSDKCCIVSVNKILQEPRQSYITHKNILIVSYSTKKFPKKMVYLNRSL